MLCTVPVPDKRFLKKDGGWFKFNKRAKRRGVLERIIYWCKT